jgi:hypothetical protein
MVRGIVDVESGKLSEDANDECEWGYRPGERHQIHIESEDGEVVVVRRFANLV